VLERADAPLSGEPPLTREIRAAIGRIGNPPPCQPVIYGLGGLGSLYALGGLGGYLGNLSLLSNLDILTTNVQTTAPAAPVVTAEQAGTWTGSWFSLVQLKGGLMNMTLVEDIVTGILNGEVNLILNKVTNSIPADVTGILPAPGAGAGTTFILTGGNQGFFGTTFLLLPSAISIYSIELTCNLTSPVTMTGTYLVQDLVKFEVDYGNFNLNLTAPII